ncbi:MAG: DUF1501 domain-containing protein [Reyranella sp.]|uniref:DUF1501 domain-containing protein n=1 Tax=Reyranella sp. TaxID=1929291 RepID=UPI001AD47C9B|nr:DUF1501 domain-containing protein [Reyranella sp.]MBN9091457.1 DUF1501 domain-containing protein [Reyranella sp.]
MSRILLLVELKGGNDGLNTVIPYADPHYRQLRPGLGVAREKVLQLDERVGLHDKLEPLMESWKARDLAIVQGVGYPNPNRSHFRSIEIWDTASSSTQTLSEGWVARAFEHAPRPQGAGRGTGVDSIVIDTNSLPLMGPDLRTIVMQDAENFLRQAQAMKDNPRVNDGGNPALRHLLAVRREINAAAAGLSDKLHAAPPPVQEYANEGPLGRELDLATRIITAQVPVVAVKIALGGFDTHANQAPVQERLLGLLAGGLATFRRNMIAAGRWDDVLVLTYSEFGRRARQNASGGTDHGTAAPHFVMGGKVKGGLHGAYPSLADLQDGDLRHTVDFRDVYSTIARGCWGQPVSFGQRQIQHLDFIAA